MTRHTDPHFHHTPNLRSTLSVFQIWGKMISRFDALTRSHIISRRILLLKVKVPPLCDSPLYRTTRRHLHQSASRYSKLIPFILTDIGEGITEVQVLQW